MEDLEIILFEYYSNQEIQLSDELEAKVSQIREDRMKENAQFLLRADIVIDVDTDDGNGGYVVIEYP